MLWTSDFKKHKHIYSTVSVSCTDISKTIKYIKTFLDTCAQSYFTTETRYSAFWHHHITVMWGMRLLLYFDLKLNWDKKLYRAWAGYYIINYTIYLPVVQLWWAQDTAGSHCFWSRSNLPPQQMETWKRRSTWNEPLDHSSFETKSLVNLWEHFQAHNHVRHCAYKYTNIRNLSFLSML